MTNKMNPENIVTSIEISKRLKELRIKQDSIFYWIDRDYSPFKTEIVMDISYLQNPVSAFTINELISFLPKNIRINEKSFHLIDNEAKGIFGSYYIPKKNDSEYFRPFYTLYFTENLYPYYNPFIVYQNKLFLNEKDKPQDSIALTIINLIEHEFIKI